MKKLLAMAALFAAMVFTGCSKDDDGENSKSSLDAQPYNGALVGTWEGTRSGAWGCYYKYTFNSNGTYTEYCLEPTDYWFKNSGNFYVSEDGEYIALLSLDEETPDDGEFSMPIEYQYLGFHKIISVDETTLTMEFFHETDDGDTTLDFDNIGYYYIYNNPIIYTKVD